jgi:hypothetical protein
VKRARTLLQLDIADHVEPRSWDRYVEALRGSVFHTHAWAISLQHRRDARPVFVRWTDPSGDVAAIALGSLRSAVRGRFAGAALTLTFDSAPAAAKDAIPELAPLIAWARDEGAALVTLGSFDSSGRSWHGELRDCNERIEFLVAPGDEDELRRRMRRTRAALHRAERLGVEVERADDSKAQQFAQLFESTVARLRRDKRVALGGVETDRFSAGLEVLLRCERARLYLARLEDAYVAGCVFGVAGGNAFYLYNGSSEAALRAGATPFTLLKAIAELSAGAFERINLGGVSASARDPASPDHGLYTFKRGLGGEPAVCHGGRVWVRPVRAALLELARAMRARSARYLPVSDQ